MMNSAVVMRDLSVTRGGRRVLTVDGLDVAAGSITGLLGPSGCGKTTLMRTIVGVQRFAGSVSVLGLPAGSSELRHRVGYVTQAPSVYGDLTVAENVRYFGAMVGAGADAASAALAAVDLTDLAGRRAEQLSGGQRARVSLAAALVGRPALLVLDEPTVGLDPLLRRRLWEFFAELAAGGTTLLVSSHVMDEAEHCDRLIFLREGAVLAADTREGMLAGTGTTSAEDAFLAMLGEQVAA
ncbi:ABC transporter ATP-binding protein [Sporichthya sp.]|uniref:ABC transporter ATP-binding protein n=1 Tax=Sporichthya sp. TaxID=65475 RepID=UPI0017B98409|nr:ABC transporter ATP-binding protein [Sporichthya sp.]MBA3742151.1 ABC transporter ATP-binding protein [Sporichthya sp.]